MKYDSDLLDMIKDNKKARERYYKNRTVAYTLQKKYLPLRQIQLDYLQKIVRETTKLDRQWRKILEDNEDLRGKDYNYKKIAEQKAQIDLGYEQGYYNDTAMRNTTKYGN